ncbi:hypothetical protein HPP92_028705 [Vanilla planifolia]|uniref:Uncharacterized protein n=1 Tax=Vanilla planifolia TaxID=51239 RepID=A0A835P6S8_VANPL|nr:hypothetical protein HPP92_028705 [Vanilla planifolia]KAG0446714.1 hypothetical protein HPP92_028690 [Vanilla planifolia]
MSSLTPRKPRTGLPDTLAVGGRFLLLCLRISVDGCCHRHFLRGLLLPCYLARLWLMNANDLPVLSLTMSSVKSVSGEKIVEVKMGLWLQLALGKNFNATKLLPTDMDWSLDVM